MAFIDNDDGYVVFEGSDDDDEIDSSDDNEEIFWWEFDRIDASKRRQRNNAASEFESEMNKELDNTVNTLHASHGMAFGARPPPTDEQHAEASTTQKFYEDIYFDSDSDGYVTQGGGDGPRPRKKHPVISNEDLFYDPDADDEDQKWVNEQRQQSTAAQKGKTRRGNGTAKEQPLPNSDAVLNCPACMTTLCRDCQRHDTYKSQYRAMFVFNCKVDFAHHLKYPVSRNRKRKKSAVSTSDQSPPSNSVDGSLQDAVYNPVHCRVCNTQVAVYDAEEIYHFFNVLASFG